MFGRAITGSLGQVTNKKTRRKMYTRPHHERRGKNTYLFCQYETIPGEGTSPVVVGHRPKGLVDPYISQSRAVS